MHSETLLTLVDKIRVQRIRLSPQPGSSQPGPWTSQEELKFCELFELYGPDFALINTHFPNRSRKQIKRKYEQIHKRIGKRLERQQMSRQIECRKNFFEEAILECNMIKWLKKPNTAESFSSQESL